MAYPVDIRSDIAILVEESVLEDTISPPCWKLHGDIFDGWTGLGGQLESEYEGDVALISETSKSIQHLRIDRYHSSRKSWGWRVETDQMPEPPFLITNKINAEIIFNGIVELDLNDYGKKLFEDRDEASFIVLGSNGWFGVMTDQLNSIHLLAYSDSASREIIGDSEVIMNSDLDDLEKFEDLDFKPFCKILQPNFQVNQTLSVLAS
jgi:hypothetical protein